MIGHRTSSSMSLNIAIRMRDHIRIASYEKETKREITLILKQENFIFAQSGNILFMLS